jgi:putative transposase
VPSYGSVGDALDNAAMETFWATLKRELAWTYATIHFETRAQLRTALFEYLEIFHNRQRRHSLLGMLTPVEFEIRHQRTTAA